MNGLARGATFPYASRVFRNGNLRLPLLALLLTDAAAVGVC
jgi:hypothetical protein